MTKNEKEQLRSSARQSAKPEKRTPLIKGVVEVLSRIQNIRDAEKQRGGGAGSSKR